MVKPYLYILAICLVGITACRTPEPTKPTEPLIDTPPVSDSSESDTGVIASEPALLATPEVQPVPTPVMSLAPAPTTLRYQFGQGDRGFVLWRAASGKLVVLMRFEDDNGDGRIEPKFGQHGEALVDAPVPYLVDVYTGQMTRVAEVLTWDASSRYVAVRPDAQSAAMQIWDAETMTRVTVDESWGVELAPDDNACLAPRQVHLSSDGMFWGIAAGEKGVIGRALSLPSRADVRIALDGDVRVWRVEPAARDWLSIMVVDEDTDGSGALDLPVQKTSCACRFCGRFAMSMGVYGWRGDAWRVKLASPDGQVSGSLDGFAFPLTSHIFVDAGSEQMLAWPGGEELAVKMPRGCARAPWLTGESPRVVLTCEEGKTLLWEPTLEAATLVVPVAIVAATEQHVVTSSAGTHWFGAIVETQGGELRAARVRLEDGLVQVGERVYQTVPAVKVDERGVMEVVADGEATFLEVESGRRWRGALDPGKKLVFSDRGGSMQVSAEAQNTFILPGGCVLAPTAVDAGIEQGPWQVECVDESARNAPE